jgi:tetratricopeptide (TPR) repeat protein
LENYQKVLEIFIKVSGQDHPDVAASYNNDVAASYNNIGNVYNRQGKYEEALDMFTKSLDIKTRIYGGDNHPDVNMGIDTYLIPEPMGTCVEMLWFWSQNPWEINSFLAFALSRVVGKG